MEISQASILDSTVETKTKLTDDLFRLLQVREKNHDMAKDWLIYLSTSKFNKLRPGEIYLAFKMAISRELLDTNGKEIELLPELSNNATGKVLNAYMKFKMEDEIFQNAKDKLKKQLYSNKEPNEEQKKSIRERFLLSIFEELAKTKVYVSDAWMLYDDLIEKLKVSDVIKKRLYRMQVYKYKNELELDVSKNGDKEYYKQLLHEFQKKTSSGKKLAVVQNRCKSIVVCNYLKRHLSSFETFKNAINN